MNEQVQQNQQQQVPPPNYLAWAIVTTIICCLPFGIVSIIYAAQVNSKWALGDYEGAKMSSKNAKLWAWVSFAVTIALGILWIILVAVVGIAGLGLGAFEGFNM